MRQSKLIGLGVIMIFVSGCGVGMRESLRGVAGISTKVLEDDLPGATSKEFNLNYEEAHSKVREIIKEIGAYIYAEDKSKDLIAVYVSGEDTTPAGIFFKAAGNAKTKILISSPSEFAKELIAGKIFSGLEK